MKIGTSQTVIYNKDKIASILFFIAFFFIYFTKDLNTLREMMLGCLFSGFIIDLIFTLNPKFYFTSIGKNVPTYIIFIGLFVFSIIFVLYRKKLKFV
jgi:hypothetical protein